MAELKSPHDSISDVSSVDSAGTTKNYNTWKKQANQDSAFLKKALQEALKCCKGEVKKMENACLIQKNVSKDIKKGIPVLKEKMADIERHLKQYDEMLTGYSDAFFEEILEGRRHREAQRVKIQETKVAEKRNRSLDEEEVLLLEKRKTKKRKKNKAKAKAPARREEKQDARKQSETQGCKKRMLLKVNSKATFSEVVKLMKQNLDPAEMHVDVSKMQRSRSGNVVFRVKGEAGL